MRHQISSAAPLCGAVDAEAQMKGTGRVSLFVQYRNPWYSQNDGHRLTIQRAFHPVHNMVQEGACSAGGERARLEPCKGLGEPQKEMEE